MKKHIIYLLALIMVLSPMAAFAQDGEAAPSGDAVAVEEQLAESGDENAVATEDVVNDSEESVVEEIPEAAAEEDAVASEEPQNAAENNDGQTTVKANSYNMKYNTETASGTPSETPAEPSIPDGWNEGRTQFFKDGVAQTGLFKAPRKDGGMGLFCANENGVVERREALYTAESGKGFVHIKNDEGEWWDPAPSGVYSYLITTHEDGEYYVHWQSGVVPIAGKYYYVTGNGTVRTNKGVQATDSDKYYIKEGGEIQTSAGIVTNTDGKKYYIQPNTNGKIQTAEGLVNANGKKWYITKKDGGAINTKKTIFTFNGGKYYSENGGAVRTKVGFFKYSNGKRYYIPKKDGKIRTTAGLFSYNGKKYYSYDGGAIRVKRGVFKAANGYKYYTSASGTVRTKTGFFTYDGKRYYAEKNGAIPLKAKIKTIGKTKYYNSSNGIIRTKIGKFKHERNGYFYFVKNKKGVLYTNKAIKFNGKLYHAKESAVLATGVHTWMDNKYYYGNPDSGVIKTSRGIVTNTKGDKYYYVQKGGKIATNAKISYKGKGYIAGRNGAFKTGMFKWNGRTYYADKKGILKSRAGYVTVNGVRYFVFAGGRVAINTMYTYNGSTYITDSKGQPRKGLINYNGHTYYAYSDGEIETSRGIRRINGRSYFIYSGGRIAKGGFISDGGVYYYAESSGVIRTYSFTYNGVIVTPNSSTGEISKDDYNKAINGITEDSTDSNSNSSNV